MSTHLSQRGEDGPALDGPGTAGPTVLVVDRAVGQESTVEVAQPGPMGRLGIWSATHRRAVAAAWLLIVVGLGAFAPRVESNLAGAGWQANGSESVTVRDLAQRHFGGNASHALQVVVRSNGAPLDKGDGP